MLRKLPLSGVQDFAKIRNEYAVYVDKTAYISAPENRYKLGYPNVEVRSSFSEFLSKRSGFDAMKRASDD